MKFEDLVTDKPDDYTVSDFEDEYDVDTGMTFLKDKNASEEGYPDDYELIVTRHLIGQAINFGIDAINKTDKKLEDMDDDVEVVDADTHPPISDKVIDYIYAVLNTYKSDEVKEVAV